MLRWLTRLFKQQVEAEAAPGIAPAPDAPPEAISSSTASETAVAVAVVEAPPVELGVVKTPVRAPAEPEPKETCPTCGRTSVFAGPPGQRFCTYCALRDELFDRQAAAQE
ncbi:MAG: hypothetical protein M3077_02240 [Candidatus Dormibacteraeota bacterium]|nr:hypothetical protein [Candidatus Dormibacteraeota bacterium]